MSNVEFSLVVLICECCAGAYGKMANHNEENDVSLNVRGSTGTRMFNTNIYNRDGTVVTGDNNVVNMPNCASAVVFIEFVGDNNVVNMPTSSPSSGPGLQGGTAVSFSNERMEEGDENIRARPGRIDRVPSSSERRNDERLTRTRELFPSVNDQQHHRDYKREKRKGENIVNEVSEFMRKKTTERKRTKRSKRERRNPRLSSTSSEDDKRDTLLNELALEQGDSSSFQQGLQVFNFYSVCLHPLRDDGRWAEFDRVAQELEDQCGGDLTKRIIICLEKSLALSYRKELERSEDMINDVVKKIAQTNGSVRLLLEVLVNCYRAGLHRRRKMLGKTEKYLNTARKLASGFPPSLPIAILLYEEGSCKQELAAVLPGSRKKSAGKPARIAEAKKKMQCCVGLCYRLDHDKVYVRKQHFAVSKMAIINLQCETSASRNETIDLHSIAEAGKRLHTLHTDYYSNSEVQGAKIQRLKAKVDLYYRIEKFCEAEKHALEALEIAQRLGFNLEKKPLEERLTDIRRKIAESSSTFREIPRITDSSSGSPSKNNSPNSSEWEVEEKR